MEQDSDEILSQLLTALATGARAVQGLPLEDDFEYQSSFPEFRGLVEESQEGLIDVLLLALGVELGGGDGNYNHMDALDHTNLDDPLLWEACADVCDVLLEQAEATTPQAASELLQARNQAQTSFGRLLKGIVDMEKPQDVYQISDNSLIQDRLQPFVPPISEKYHAVSPLNLNLHPGHGLETRFGGLRRGVVRTTSNNNTALIAPAHHVPHVYQSELEALEFAVWQLEKEANATQKPEPIAVATDKELIATWIDTPQALQELATKLENVKEIAIDLEAHSYRSFPGITCLMQITIGDHDNYLIDPFPLWNQLNAALGPALANPNIVKILHGADSDVQWLQRDFGLYIVNLFDTGRAARALRLSSAGYAHLLQTYVSITADKTHQLSDWRQRPLPQAMKEYAIMDTHYLLDIYRHLNYALQKHATASVEQVLDDSRKVCLIRYAPDAFKPEGYRALMNRRGTKTQLNTTQEQVLKELWDWRDQVARQCDESHAYVCTNNALMRLALACPTSLTALQGLLQPMPPLVLRNAKQVLGLVQRCVKPPFFKPATADREESRLMSPVMGTEALYRQAGWISPHVDDKSTGAVDAVTTTTDEDGPEDTELKPRHVLAVHEANQKYRTSQFTSHSLQLGENGDDDETDVVDGMGSARAAHPQDLKEEAQMAQTNAAHIRSAQEKHAMIGLISPTTDMEEDDDEDNDVEAEVVEKAVEEEFVMPRSMREIYRISNRNRRNKKSSSPLPAGEPNDKEAQELAKAEEVLKARTVLGKNYFDEIPGTPKRQRTKSTGTASQSSEEAALGHDSGNLSREEDIALMQDIGWIKGKEEVDSMLKQRHAADGDAADEGDASSEDEATKASKPFDYSTIGPIGAFSATPSANPFFAGAATVGGQLNQQFGKPEPKRKQNAGGRGSKQSRRQVERPERKDGRAQVYKKR